MKPRLSSVSTKGRPWAAPRLRSRSLREFLCPRGLGRLLALAWSSRRARTKKSPNVIERPNIYESANVARSKAAQGKLNVQKYGCELFEETASYRKTLVVVVAVGAHVQANLCAPSCVAGYLLVLYLAELYDQVDSVDRRWKGFCIVDIEAQIREIQGKKPALDEAQGVGLDSTGYYDQEIYGGSDSRFAGYVTSIAATELEDDDDDYPSTSLLGQKKPGYHAPVALLNDIPQSTEQYDPFAEHRPQKIADREDEYKKHRRMMIISPERLDPFADGGKTPDPKMNARTYMDVMREQHLTKEEREIRQQLAEKAKAGELKVVNGAASQPPSKRKRRWDQTADQTPGATPKKLSSWDQAETPGHTPSLRWDETPGRAKGSETPGATPGSKIWDPTPSHTPAGAATPGRDTPGHATPGHGGATSSARKNRWDETPKTERDTPGHGSGWAETPRTDRGGDSIGETPTPGASKRKSRWDETPASQMGGSTPVLTPGKTPIGTPAMNMATPTPGHIMSMTPEQLQAWRWEREIDERNRPLSDEELDAMFPEGYKVLPPPAGYVPIRTPARKLTATPTPLGGMTGFHMQTEDRTMKSVNDQPSGNLPFLKPDDIQYFDKLLVDVDESTLSPEEQKERKIMKLLLKIKNGTPPMRK
ncbi:PREDICTED: splicing factor 3B subunit 1-like, partial [Cariama cristata]|uniref:splicing factor 3B subunit 1-like n=1 Tax=Cariama cristata TaxID=54380 RepID=UPI000520B9BA